MNTLVKLGRSLPPCIRLVGNPRSSEEALGINQSTPFTETANAGCTLLEGFAGSTTASTATITVPGHQTKSSVAKRSRSTSRRKHLAHVLRSYLAKRILQNRQRGIRSTPKRSSRRHYNKQVVYLDHYYKNTTLCNINSLRI